MGLTIAIKLIKFLSYISLATVLFLTVVYFTPGILPNVTFDYYEVQPAYPLQPNSILNNAKIIVDGELEKPESILIRGKDEVYVGDSTGKIVKYHNGKLSTIIKLGFPCDFLDKKICSYPLGAQFDSKGKLIVADVFGGILSVNVDKGTFETLVSRYDAIDGKYPGTTEDVAITRDGSIYWTDGTTVASPENGPFSWIGHPRGRLLKYNPVTNKSEALVENIYFANGMQLSEDEEFVLVAEMMRFRIIRHFIKGKRQGHTDIFTDDLPGYPDNIRSNGKGGYYVAIISRRPAVEYEIGKHPYIAKLYSKLRYLASALTRYTYDIYPNVFLKRVDELINYLGVYPLFMGNNNSNALIIELDKNGKIIGSLQSTNGQINSLSHIAVGKEHAYMVSPFHDKIWQIELRHLQNN